MAHTSEGATASVKAVRFNFLTDEEVKKHSYVKVTNPTLLDSVERPVPGGLYDPAMGPVDDRTFCKSCGQRLFHCPGHCGHIDLISPVYNPLLFHLLHNLLQRTCFYCHHFRADRSQVKTCVSQLELIIKGDIAGAKGLDSVSPSESLYAEESDGSHVSCSTVHSGAQCHSSKHLKQQEWTSLQFTEAMYVLNTFLKTKYKQCKNCGAKNPTISKPTFGWFYMSATSAQTRANVIRGCNLEGPLTGGAEGTPSSEVEKAIDGVYWGSDVDAAETQSSSAVSPGAQDSAEKGYGGKSGKGAREFSKQRNVFSGPLLPSEVKDIVKLLWENEAQLCSFISDIQQLEFGKISGHFMFFLDTVLVPPIKFRPPSKGGDSVMEHPQTVLLAKVLLSNISLREALDNKLERSKIVNRWMELQQSVNVLYDSKTAPGQGQRTVALGICQLLEKKEGLFRQKMMGKRVNHACRSVISPDPYLAVNEIGIPPYFALRLTYPERVTPWNVAKLRAAIINGPEVHPGATHYVDKLSTKILPPVQKGRISISRKLPSSRAVVTQPGKSNDYDFEGKIVYRHLQDGDIVLVNRQPTLHKPSIMAHVVRVLKGEKTLRMHYANCSTYNADFDGDEMNVHFPQDEISRAEAYNIVNANNQYIVPSRGEPIRALIQDHIVSAVLLTKKDTFLRWDEFNQLLYSSGVSAAGPGSFSGKPGKKVYTSSSEDEMQPLLPAILKPKPLWTGKQVITAVLNHITRGCPPLTVMKDGKLPLDFFRSKSDEDISSEKENNESKLSEDKKDDEDNKLGKEKDGDEGKRPKSKGSDKVKSRKEKSDDKGKLSKEKGADKGKMRREKEAKEGRYEKKEDPVENKLLIYRNDLVHGVIDKAQFGDYGLIHTVQELYGSNTAGILLSVLSRLFTVFLQMHGFTCGVDDLLIMKGKDIERKKKLEGCEESGEEIHRNFLKDDKKKKIDQMLLSLNIEKVIRGDGESASTRLDRFISGELNKSTSEGVIQSLLSEGLLKPSWKNCIYLMTTSGAKGSKVNFQQISAFLGQQELEGKRVPRMVSGKTLPCFPPWDYAPRAGGFIIDRFLTGLRPQEYYFHCMAGREGLVDTAVKTSRSGYLQRCLIKNLECLKICYDHTVRDADGSIVQFRYGEDGIDVHQTSFIEKFDALAANQEMFKEKSRRQIDKSNNYVADLPSSLIKKAEKFLGDYPLNERILSNMMKQEDLLKLMKHKYLSSLAQPGEPVGVLAAQSVGEPSTQMTLNTFHLAGRGEMNVTLGIPRLQEILMAASNDIKTPVMTCPLREGKSEEDGKRLAGRLRKITLADLLESIDVSVVPLDVKNNQISSIYKLKMKLCKPELFLEDCDISLEDCEKTLEVVFVRELEDAIQNHMLLLSRISGIKNFVLDSRSKASNDRDEEASGRSQGGKKNDDDDDDDEDDDNSELAEDLGLDAQKQKQQAIDEMDYEDGSEEELDEGEPSAGSKRDIDQAEDEDAIIKDDVTGASDAEDATSKMPSDHGSPLMPKSSDKKDKSFAKRKKEVRAKVYRKETDRAIYVAAKGLHFEVHFKFINEPHILLAQVATRTAKKVSIKSSGKIGQCRQIKFKDNQNQVIYYGQDPKKREEISYDKKESIMALQTDGVDFNAIWKLQDHLDVRYVYSNHVQAMLNTYGVEAARETIIREVKHVFNSYGISVNIRHLTLIADFMTHSGGYRPMSRLGGIAESISPFSKMTFETAAKFIVEAACHGEMDNLESPSARICLGLPVKVGTGCFDLMQKVDL